jgi:integrase
MLNFKYAELAKGARWYVHYQVLNPATGLLVRKRIYIDRMDAKLKERYARKLCTKINEKLDQGWNPFISEKDNRQYTRINKAFDFLITYKGSFVSHKSKQTYSSRIKLFFEYLKTIKKDGIFIFEFTDKDAIDYFEYLLLEKGIKGRTYNNYLLDFRSFFNFFIKHRYISENPFQAVDTMPEEEKEKQPFTVEEATKYKDYLLENDIPFYVITCLCYYCALRPVEITRLKVSMIDTVQKQIKLPGSSTKNKKNRVVPVPNVFWPYLENHIKKATPGMYVCSKDFVPGLQYVWPVRISEHFRVIADEIGLPVYVKFYSLKDTAAERLDVNNVGVKTIRDLFGHSNIAITDNYMRGFRNRELDGLRDTFPEL